MIVGKAQRHYYRLLADQSDNAGVGVTLHPDILRDLLDMADERDRYRALLTVAASVLSEDGDTTEADARALYRRIDAALEGNDGD